MTATTETERIVTLGMPHTRQRQRRRDWRTNNKMGYLFILPSIIGCAVFVAYPLVMSAYYSLTHWNGVTAPRFIGFGNYITMFTKDPLFWGTFWNTIVYAVISVPLALVLGLALAVLLNRKLKGVKVFRTIFYLPVVLPAVAVLSMWKYLFDPQFGLVNQVLGWFGIPPLQWLQSPDTSLMTVILIGLWGVGGTMIIFLAGLQNVPDDIIEAAKLDGAGAWRTFWTMTLPMITPILLLQLVLGIKRCIPGLHEHRTAHHGRAEQLLQPADVQDLHRRIRRHHQRDDGLRNGRGLGALRVDHDHHGHHVQDLQPVGLQRERGAMIVPYLRSSAILPSPHRTTSRRGRRPADRKEEGDLS